MYTACITPPSDTAERVLLPRDEHSGEADLAKVRRGVLEYIDCSGSRGHRRPKTDVIGATSTRRELESIVLARRSKMASRSFTFLAILLVPALVSTFCGPAAAAAEDPPPTATIEILQTDLGTGSITVTGDGEVLDASTLITPCRPVFPGRGRHVLPGSPRGPGRCQPHPRRRRRGHRRRAGGDGRPGLDLRGGPSLRQVGVRRARRLSRWPIRPRHDPRVHRRADRRHLGQGGLWGHAGPGGGADARLRPGATTGRRSKADSIRLRGVHRVEAVGLRISSAGRSLDRSQPRRPARRRQEVVPIRAEPADGGLRHGADAVG